jgi:ferredoxin
MVGQHDAERFGGCTNIGECSAACPKEIPLDVISRLNWDLFAALRHDDLYAYVAAWEWGGAEPGSKEMGKPVLHKENLTYEFVEMKQRSYK